MKNTVLEDQIKCIPQFKILSNRSNFCFNIWINIKLKSANIGKMLAF